MACGLLSQVCRCRDLAVAVGTPQQCGGPALGEGAGG